MKGKMFTSDPLKAYIVFQHHRNTTNLYKAHLSIIRDIYEDHALMLKKLEQYLPQEALGNIDHLTEEKYNYIRKKTLDLGNEAIRDFEANMEKVNIILK
jgi:thiamine pyrophosphokinase|tara:strand:- start:22060 stop:22356 length:297 start_codon:yes stop_codon:yes gene_type:complete